MQYNIFKPEKLSQTIKYLTDNNIPTLVRITDQVEPSSQFVRNVIDILELTPKLAKLKRLLEKLIKGPIITLYDEKGVVLTPGTLYLDNNRIWKSKTVSNLAKDPVKHFLFAYNSIYNIANFVQNEYDFLVEKGDNNLNDSFLIAVYRARIQYKYELDIINKSLNNEF